MITQKQLINFIGEIDAISLCPFSETDKSLSLCLWIQGKKFELMRTTDNTVNRIVSRTVILDVLRAADNKHTETGNINPLLQ